MNNEEKILSMLEQMQGEIEAIKHNMVTHDELRTIIESEINPKFELLTEGHQMLLETLAPRNKVEALEEDVVILKSAFSAMSKELAELKAAM